MPPLHLPAYPRQEFGSSNTPALAGDVFRFAIWLFFSFLTFSVGRIHPYIHSYTLGVQVGIYGVLAPLRKSQKDLGEGLGQGSSDSWGFFFLDFFLMWIIFKVFIEFICYNIVSVLCFFFFGFESCGISAPRSGIEPTSLVLEGEILTTGLPGKSHSWLLI